METAVPLQPGNVEVTNYVARGLELGSAVVLEQNGQSYIPSHDRELDARGETIFGYKANIGVYKNFELCGKYYGAMLYNDNNVNKSATRGYKLGLKVNLWNQDKMFFSVLPSVNVVDGNTVGGGFVLWQDDSAFLEKANYHSLGYELQLIGTYEPNPYIAFTVVQKFNKNFYEETYNGHKYDNITLNHRGTKLNVKIGYKPVYIIAETGFEFVPVKNGHDTSLDSFAFGVGIRTWKSKGK